jgi:hypothetical protein
VITRGHDDNHHIVALINHYQNYIKIFQFATSKFLSIVVEFYHCNYKHPFCFMDGSLQGELMELFDKVGFGQDVTNGENSMQSANSIPIGDMIH